MWTFAGIPSSRPPSNKVTQNGQPVLTADSTKTKARLEIKDMGRKVRSSNTGWGVQFHARLDGKEAVDFKALERKSIVGASAGYEYLRWHLKRTHPQVNTVEWFQNYREAVKPWTNDKLYKRL
jgi:hypothetical protein